jgi:hypothetical protein
VSIADAIAQIYYTRETYQTAANIAVPTLWSVPVSLDTTTNGTDSVHLVPYTNQGGAGLGRAPMAVGLLLAVWIILSTARVCDRADVDTVSDLPQSTYTMIDIDSTLPNLQLSVEIMTPAGVSLDDCGARPVLIYAYSGPGSQQVTTMYQQGYASQSSFHSALSFHVRLYRRHRRYSRNQWKW